MPALRLEQEQDAEDRKRQAGQPQRPRDLEQFGAIGRLARAGRQIGVRRIGRRSCHKRQILMLDGRMPSYPSSIRRDQRQRTFFWSIAAPAAAPPAAPSKVPSVFDPPGAMMLPSAPPAIPPTISPVVPSERLQ